MNKTAIDSGIGMTSYEISNKLKIHHSDLVVKLLNLANEFDGEVMRFERKSDAYFELNPTAAALTLLLLGEDNG